MELKKYRIKAGIRKPQEHRWAAPAARLSRTLPPLRNDAGPSLASNAMHLHP